jgi:hypothetical protein
VVLILHHQASTRTLASNPVSTNVSSRLDPL